jgi:hypothetical protein
VKVASLVKISWGITLLFLKNSQAFAKICSNRGFRYDHSLAASYSVPERSLCVERGCGCPDEVADGPGRGEGRDEDRMVYPDKESAIESISVPVLKRQS